MEKCNICASSQRRPFYQGPVRVGKFGNLSRQPHTVWLCEACGGAWLEGATIDYEADDYRQLVDDSADPAAFYKIHDGEQAEKLALIGTHDLRGKTVADIGCGAGSFLDLVKGYAAVTVAIEPTKAYHGVLESKGHQVFSYGSDAARAWAGKIDFAVCFSVIEHVEDPLGLLRQIHALLAPGGKALISTPNRNDWLLELLPNEYASFFYRQVHRWYFDDKSLAAVARRAGFSEARPFFVHRFDISNFLLWLRDRRPSGLGKVAAAPGLNTAFRQSLIDTGRADYLYAWLHA
jgi:SAM-dependent methyltransferase